MTTLFTRHFRISGRVQGVGFRYWTQQEAKRLGLSGWVCNRPDSTVEAEASGSDEMLDAFEKWLQQGPPGARVDRVESTVPDDDRASESASIQGGYKILR